MEKEPLMESLQLSKGKQITKSKNVVIPDAFSLYQCAQNSINMMKMYFMSTNQIENH